MTKALGEKLVRAARRAAANAYAPYSKLKVGAAMLDDKGRIHSGCNVENGSLGLTVCAERVAVFKAVSEGARHIKAVAVYAASAARQSKTPNPKSEIPLVPPCGACLQVVYEFGPDAEVVLSNGKQTKRYHLKDLLPHGFKFGER